MTCREQEKKWGKYISLIQNGSTKYIMFFSTGDFAVVNKYEIIMLKYIVKACRLCLLCFGGPDDIILQAIRQGDRSLK